MEFHPVSCKLSVEICRSESVLVFSLLVEFSELFDLVDSRNRQKAFAEIEDIMIPSGRWKDLENTLVRVEDVDSFDLLEAGIGYANSHNPIFPDTVNFGEFADGLVDIQIVGEIDGRFTGPPELEHEFQWKTKAIYDADRFDAVQREFNSL
ncbi:MAG: hypothetical protein ACI92S_000173 [Planctomycetaceae bacterium]|jgi:hypothetical protein